MDRQEIERQDFPSARRGYDATAVHDHLRRVADAFERAAAERAAGSLAEGASTRVMAILEAAETSAQELRDDAGREASRHVEGVADSARGMLAKLDHAQSELERLLAGLRSTAEGLAGSLDELGRDVGTVRGVDEDARDAAVRGEAGAKGGRGADARGEAGAKGGRGADARGEAGAKGGRDAAAPGEEPAPEPDGERSADEAGARLVALNMALEGSPREETGRYLAARYELPDVEALLDDVYASAEK